MHRYRKCLFRQIDVFLQVQSEEGRMSIIDLLLYVEMIRYAIVRSFLKHLIRRDTCALELMNVVFERHEEDVLAFFSLWIV